MMKPIIMMRYNPYFEIAEDLIRQFAKLDPESPPLPGT